MIDFRELIKKKRILFNIKTNKQNEKYGINVFGFGKFSRTFGL